MANKGTNEKGGKKGETNQVSASVTETTIPVPDATELAEAKERSEEARKKLQQIKAKIRRAKQLKEKYAERKAKMEAQIARARVGTTQSAEELATKADEFESEAAKLLRENRSLLVEFDEMDGQLSELNQQLREIRSENKKARAASSGGTIRTGSVAAAKAALVKALGRRQWIVRYDSDGAAEWATKSEGGVDARIDFTDEAWTTTVGGETKTEQYGAGAIQIADGLFPKDKNGKKATAAA